MEKYCPKCFKKYPAEVERCAQDGSYLVAPMDKDLTGQVLDDRYIVLERIGRGGMGVVYKAEQNLIKRVVALKVLRREIVQDETAVKRFLNEARAIASLDSPHTVTLHDFGVTKDGLLYYTMELLKGRPLSRIIRDEGPLDHVRASDLVMQACRSLDEAHEHGILHRDIKPDNLFVEKKAASTTGLTAGRELLKVLDFGIAKLVGDSHGETVTRTGMIIGTPQYLSPEQALGNPVVPASDMYSLAIVLYEMLAGRPPFLDETPMKTMWAHVRDPVPPVAKINPKVQVPRSIEAFLARALEKDPAERYQTAAEFSNAIEQAVREHAQSPFTVPLPPLSADDAGLRLKTQTFPKTGEPGPAPGAGRESGPAGEPGRKPTAQFDSAVRAELDELRNDSGRPTGTPRATGPQPSSSAAGTPSQPLPAQPLGTPPGTPSQLLPGQPPATPPATPSLCEVDSGGTDTPRTSPITRAFPRRRLSLLAAGVGGLLLLAGALAFLAVWNSSSSKTATEGSGEPAASGAQSIPGGNDKPAVYPTGAPTADALQRETAAPLGGPATTEAGTPGSTEAEELARKNAEARLEAEELARRNAEAKAEANELFRRNAEAKKEAEDLARMNAEAKKEAEDLATAQAEAEEKKKAESLTNKKAEEKKEAESLTNKKAEEKKEAESLTNKKAEEVANAKAETKKKAEEGANAKAEAKKKAVEDASAKAEAKKKAVEEAQAKAEELAREKAEAEAKKKALALAKAQEEAEARARAEEEARQKAEAEAYEKAEREAREREEAEARREEEEEARALKVEQLLNAAEAADENGEYDTCIRLLKDALKLDPGNAWGNDTLKACKEKKELQDLKL